MIMRAFEINIATLDHAHNNWQLAIPFFFFSNVSTCTDSTTASPATTAAGPAAVTAKTGCKSWCAPKNKPWSVKCAWKTSCGGCSECNGKLDLCIRE